MTLPGFRRSRDLNHPPATERGDCSRNHPTQQREGFTLIELSVALVVIGILIALSVKSGVTMSENARIIKNKADMDRAVQAVINFAALNKRLPCPEGAAAGIEGTNGGTCAASVGALPYNTVDFNGTAIQHFQDTYYNDYIYALYSNTPEAADLGAVSSNNTTIGDFCNTLRKMGTTPGISIANNTYLNVNVTGAPNNVAFVIASRGPNRAFDATGVNNVAGLSFENPARQPAMPDPPNNTTTYDDLVQAVSFSELANRLKCATVNQDSTLVFTTSALPVFQNGSSYGNGTGQTPPYRIEASGGVRRTGAAGAYRWCLSPNTVVFPVMGLNVTSSNNTTLTPQANCTAVDEATWAQSEFLMVTGTANSSAGIVPVNFSIFVRDDNQVNSQTAAAGTYDHIVTRQYSITVTK